MLKRLTLGLMVCFMSACGGTATTTTSVTSPVPVLMPQGDIVAQACLVPDEWLFGNPPTNGVCAYFPLGVFGAAQVPASPGLMPEYDAGAECFLVWLAGTSMSPYCYTAGGAPTGPQVGAVTDEDGEGYNYGAILVPEGTTRVVGTTLNGIDLVSVPARGLVLLWWPGNVSQAAFTRLYAETLSGLVELPTG
jgi:hypothetical protein